MLLISDPEVRQVLSMGDCIEVMERAFAEESKGIAVSAPRTRYKVQPDLDQPGYMATIIPGAVPSCEVAAPRYASTIVQERIVAGTKRMDFYSPTKRNWDFVMLFSLQTGEPLALIHDYSLSAIRVGATTGVVHRLLAKKNSKIVGIFGSGHQARANLCGSSNYGGASRAHKRSANHLLQKQHRTRYSVCGRWSRDLRSL